jgi:hypothetical protein
MPPFVPHWRSPSDEAETAQSLNRLATTIDALRLVVILENRPVTLASGATEMVATTDLIEVTPDAGGNTIATIVGGELMQILYLRKIGSNVVTFTDNGPTATAGQMNLGADWVPGDDTPLILFHQGTHWVRLSMGLYLSGGNYGIGTSSPEEFLHIKGVNSRVRVEDSGGTPSFDLFRNIAGLGGSASENEVGHIHFQGLNDAGERITYASIRGIVQDNTDTAERGKFEFISKRNGTNVVHLRIKYTGEVEIPGDLTVDGTLEVGTVDTGWTTFSNLSTDKTCDANATTVPELADILGTLIEELKTIGLISA